jgi:hypothetical protein
MDTGRNAPGGGFGRRRTLLGEAPPRAAREPSKPFKARTSQSTKKRLDPVRLALLVFLGVGALLGLEAIFSNTSLITPINSTFLNIMRGIGLVIGLLLGLAVVADPDVRMGIGKKIIMILFTPIFVGFGANEAAWRIADWVDFGFSSAPFTAAQYPIKFAGFGRKGRRDSFEIDPFYLKEGTSIAVPAAQFEAIWRDYDEYCITVMQRRSASGAIEILNDGEYTLSEPAPARLTRCPEAQQERKRREEEYSRQRASSRRQRS